MFTRSTQYKVLDSKRCSHTGSCIGEKCGKINRMSLIPELREANKYAGITRCVESCGGLGCDCFYPSSGCLFYRIYLVPLDDNQYEIFRCTRWKETVAVQISIIDKYGNYSVTRDVILKPNIPYQGNKITITLSAVTLPPTPILADYFISNGEDTARWPKEYKPPLRCATVEKARHLKCAVIEECSCSPAENSIQCECTERNISQIFYNMENRLPFTSPSVKFQQTTGSVIASVPTLPTAEFILHLDESTPVSIQVEDTTCSIEPTHIEECYSCSKGAKAVVNCIADKRDQMAELRCEGHTFTIPCSLQGTTSVLLFNYERATVHTKCEIKCGTTPTYTELTGILRYTGNLQQSLRRMVNGESNILSEINIPDIGHVATVFIQWYTTTVFTCIGVCLALALTCLYVVTCGPRITSSCGRLILQTITSIGRKLLHIPLWFFRSKTQKYEKSAKDL
uniref:Phlebovirus_G2 domain-containing protein n=1 Tax=Heterorhabditis bacteriophora TaxID=37862 RepID=A0A1I7WUC0_HETBA